MDAASKLLTKQSLVTYLILAAILLAAGHSFAGATGKILLRADMPSLIRVDGKNLGRLDKDATKILNLAAGEHLLEANSPKGSYRWEKIVTVVPDRQIFIQTDLLTAQKAHELKLREQQAETRAMETAGKELKKIVGKWLAISVADDVPWAEGLCSGWTGILREYDLSKGDIRSGALTGTYTGKIINRAYGFDGHSDCSFSGLHQREYTIRRTVTMRYQDNGRYLAEYRTDSCSGDCPDKPAFVPGSVADGRAEFSVTPLGKLKYLSEGDDLVFTSSDGTSERETFVRETAKKHSEQLQELRKRLSYFSGLWHGREDHEAERKVYPAILGLTEEIVIDLPASHYKHRLEFKDSPLKDDRMVGKHLRQDRNGTRVLDKVTLVYNFESKDFHAFMATESCEGRNCADSTEDEDDLYETIFYLDTNNRFIDEESDFAYERE